MRMAHVEKKRKMFQATMLVTGLEEWCVEASSPDEARELLASGNAHRCHVGDCLHLEVERFDAEGCAGMEGRRSEPPVRRGGQARLWRQRLRELHPAR